MQRALQLGNCSWQQKKILVEYVFPDFDFENDIVNKAGNAVDLRTHCKNSKL